MSEAARAAPLDMLASLVRTHDIRATMRSTPAGRWATYGRGHIYNVRLVFGIRELRMQVEGTTPPTVAGLLAGLAREARLIGSVGSEAELAKALGESPRNLREWRDVHRRYKAMCQRRDELRTFLGDDLYVAVLGAEEVRLS